MKRYKPRTRRPHRRKRYLAQLLVAGQWVTYRRDRHGRCRSLVDRWLARGCRARLVPEDHDHQLLREACRLLRAALDDRLDGPAREQAQALVERATPPREPRRRR